MKKLLLGLGAATSVIAPIAAVVACGDTDAAAKPVVKNLVIAKRFGHTGAAMTEIREIATLAAGSTISINGHKSAILTTEQLKELKVAGTNTGTQKKHDRKKGYFVVLLKLIQTGDSTATIQDITIPKVKITSTSDAIAQKADILALVAGDVIKDGVSAIHHDYVVLEGKDITALSGATGTDDAFKAAVKAITDRGRGTVTVTIVGDTIAVADSQRDMKGMKIIRKIAALVKGDKIIYKGTTTTLTEAEVNGLASAGASGTQHMGSKNANAWMEKLGTILKLAAGVPLQTFTGTLPKTITIAANFKGTESTMVVMRKIQKLRVGDTIIYGSHTVVITDAHVASLATTIARSGRESDEAHKSTDLVFSDALSDILGLSSQEKTTFVALMQHPTS